MLKAGDKVLVYCKLGFQKQECDNYGTFLRHANQHSSLVDFGGRFEMVPRRKVQKYEFLSDEELGQFATEHFDTMVSECREACAKLLPKSLYEPIEVETEYGERSVHFGRRTATIMADRVLRRTITSAKEVPGWRLTSYREYPGDYSNPPEVDVVNVADQTTSHRIAEELVKFLFEVTVNDYFAWKSTEAYVESVKEEHQANLQSIERLRRKANEE